MARMGGRPNHSKHNKRLQVTFCNKTTFNEDNFLYNRLRGNTSQYYNGRGNTKPARNARIRTHNRADGIYISHVLKKKIGRHEPTNIQPKMLKPISSTNEVSTDNTAKNTTIPSASRFHDKDRHIESVFPCSCRQVTQAVSNDKIRTKNLPNDLPAIRTCHGPTNICKINKLGGQCYEESGNKSGSLLRRFPYCGAKRRNCTQACRVGEKLPRISGVVSEQGKVRNRTNSKARISRDHVGYQKQPKIYKYEQTHNHKGAIESNIKEKKMHLDTSKKAIGSPQLCIFCHTSRQTALPVSSKGFQQNETLAKKQDIRPVKRVAHRLPLVAETIVEFNKNSRESSLHFHNDRRVGHRMGCYDKRCTSKRILDQRTEQMALQQKRNVDCISSFKKAQISSYEKNMFNTVGQQNGNSLYLEARRDKISFTSEACTKNLSPCQGSEYNDHRKIHSRTIQCDIRQPFTRKDSPRMVTVTPNSGKNISQMGNPTSRPIRLSKISSGPDLCNRRHSRQECFIRRRFHETMELGTSICVSSSMPTSKSSLSLKQSGGYIHHCMPQMGESLLERGPQSESSGTPICNTKPRSELDRQGNQPTPTDGRGLTIGNLEGTGWPSEIDMWPKEYKDLLTQSWRKSTLKTYHSAWERWKTWAKDNKCQPIDPKPEQVAKYLCYLRMSQNIAPSTIMVHKSVICTFGNPLKSEEMAHNPLIKRIIKALSLERPKQRKQIWNLDVILDWIDNSTVAENNLYEVSRHTALLLLLHSGRRVHDLTLLKISSDYMQCSEDNSSVILWPSFGSKTDSVQHTQSGWLLKKNEKRNIDVTYWIKRLITLSQTRRSARENLDNLFITTLGTVKAASKSVISGWITNCLKEAGVNASPGSIRAAVASDNFTVRGLKLNEIINNGNWKCKETFIKYYYKEIQRESGVYSRPSAYFQPV